MAKSKPARIANRLSLVEALRVMAAKPADVPLTFGPIKGGEGFVVTCAQGEYLAAAKTILDEAPGILATIAPEPEA